MRIAVEKFIYKYYYYSLPICNKIHHGITNGIIKKTVFLIALPLIIFKRFFGALVDMILGIRTRYIKKNEALTRYKYDLAIVAIAKNEKDNIGPFLFRIRHIHIIILGDNGRL